MDVASFTGVIDGAENTRRQSACCSEPEAVSKPFHRINCRLTLTHASGTTMGIGRTRDADATAMTPMQTFLDSLPLANEKLIALSDL
jgi:hypothetical protein